MVRLEAGHQRARHMRLSAWGLWSVSILTLIVSLLMGRQEALAVHPLVVLALPLWSVSQRIWSPRQAGLPRTSAQAEAWIPLGWAVLLAVVTAWAFMK